MELTRLRDGRRYISHNISGLTFPESNTCVCQNSGKDGIHETIVSGRILDRVFEGLEVPYSNSSTYMSFWLEKVIMR